MPPEWEPGRRDTLETLLGDFAPTLSSVGAPECPHFAAESVKLIFDSIQSQPIVV